jgi:NADPH:quinone reductase-like Zn-dependent oxidoreductase
MVQLCQSTIIDAPVDTVWRVLRDFNGHDRWHPAIASSAIENGEAVDAVGSVRRFRLTDGGELREQLLALSDEDRRLTYCLLESPLPLTGYVAQIRLKPVTDGNRTFWEWRSEFHPPANRREELTRLVSEGIYGAGFAAIRRLLASERREAPAISRAVNAPAQARPEPVEPPVFGGMDRTRAIVVAKHGGPEVLEFREIGLPLPGYGEVRIRHTAIGVNFIDVYCRTGYFDLLRPPGVPGMEAAGVIEATGPGVAGFSTGERVAYACPPVGAYSERRIMSPELLVRLQDDIADEIAAGALLKGIAASFLLHDVHSVRAGTVVLVHAAAGGIGQILVQWASHLGATVIATASSDEKANLAKRLGAHHAIVYTQENFADAVMEITGGKGADVVYDAVGNDTFAGSLAALAVRGHLVSFGQASGPVGNWDIGRFSSRSITVSRPNYGHFTDTQEKLAPHVNRFFAALRQDIVRIERPRRYPLADAAAAHHDLESRRSTGSLVLVPGPALGSQSSHS